MKIIINIICTGQSLNNQSKRIQWEHFKNLIEFINRVISDDFFNTGRIKIPDNRVPITRMGFEKTFMKINR